MSGRRDTEVLVAGAGPVGLYAALWLTERGVRVRIVDEEQRGATRSFALALHPRSLELLDEVGLTPELLAGGRRVDTVAFHGDGERELEVSLADVTSRYPFVLVLPQSALEAALERRLGARGGEVHRSERLSAVELGDTGATATLQDLARESLGYATEDEWVVRSEATARAAFVLGADGHRSRVRRALGIGFEPVAPSQLFAIFELSADRPAPDELQVVLDRHTSVLWPLDGNRRRWTFEIEAHEADESARDKSRVAVVLGKHSYGYLDATMFRRLEGERAPWLETGGSELTWSLAARFERRVAASLGRGSVFLAGDAAHLAAPMGVQSMNTGLWEARELCQRMFAVLREGGRRDELVRFGEDWLRAFGPVVATASSVEATDAASPWVRENAARIVDCLPASGEHLDSLIARLGLRLRR